MWPAKAARSADIQTLPSGTDATVCHVMPSTVTCNSPTDPLCDDSMDWNVSRGLAVSVRSIGLVQYRTSTPWPRATACQLTLPGSSPEPDEAGDMTKPLAIQWSTSARAGPGPFGASASAWLPSRHSVPTVVAAGVRASVTSSSRIHWSGPVVDG